jgi:hypothetical protein
MILFKRAERKQAKLRLAICGPSGSGKTYSALLIAQGLGGRVAMIDTERGSGELYADLSDYDVAQLTPPFTPDRYIELIKGAEAAGDNVCIIDSLSHAWTGEGGVLDLHDRAAKAVKNSFTAWREVTPRHNALVDALLNADMHIIVTMRTKVAYEMVEETNASGKKVQKPVKIGLAPIQREGIDYEFTVVFDLSIDGHIASTSKDRTSLFDGQYFTPGIETGRKLLDWLNTGRDETTELRHHFDEISAGFHLCDSPSQLEEVGAAYKTAISKLPAPMQSALKTTYKSRMAQLKQQQQQNAA